MRKEDWSDLLASGIAGLLLLVFGFLIPDVDSTWYPSIASMLVIQAAIGSVVLHSRKIEPPATKVLTRGNIDIFWGFKYLWWTLWWPMFLGKK